MSSSTEQLPKGNVLNAIAFKNIYQWSFK